MRTVIVLFNRDLRVSDHPALHEAAARADTVVPLFVLDDRILACTHDSPNRLSNLLGGLHELRESLRSRGGDLVVERGNTVEVTMRRALRHGADAVFASADVTSTAHRREQDLAAACAEHRIGLTTFPGVTVVPAGALRPKGSDHYRVFTPYWRAWTQARRRRVLPAPRRITLPDGVEHGQIPRLRDLTSATPSPHLPPAGESAGRRTLADWAGAALARYRDRHDDLAADGTSRLSSYLHFGFVSPLEVAARVEGLDGSDPFLRQLCWRDFHHQVTAAFGPISREDYRPRGDRWRSNPGELDAWRDGRTGLPIVDAGMRQLRAEGWMHNRARLVTASFLTKWLRLDWREGAAHFQRWLVDGDVANNSGNWQWVAGTGNDTRPNRTFNPLRQAQRFDPDGGYVRRYLPELAAVAGRAVHRPWRLDDDERRRLDYPAPIVDPDERGDRPGARRIAT